MFERFMMKNKGFTLIELLIVILIIGILVGAVLPFVQQYVYESRVTRAKQDLDEIKNGLIRFETDQRNQYLKSDISDLVGPYINRAMADPWGSPYKISPASSSCYSLGPDGQASTGDEVVTYFRPPLAISRAYWEDTDGDLLVNDGDKLVLKFTRPIRDNVGDGPTLVGMPGADDLDYSTAPQGDYADPPGIEWFDNKMTIKLTLDFGGGPPFKIGQDTVTAKSGSKIVDGDGVPCKDGPAITIKSNNF